LTRGHLRDSQKAGGYPRVSPNHPGVVTAATAHSSPEPLLYGRPNKKAPKKEDLDGQVWIKVRLFA